MTSLSQQIQDRQRGGLGDLTDKNVWNSLPQDAVMAFKGDSTKEMDEGRSISYSELQGLDRTSTSSLLNAG